MEIRKTASRKGLFSMIAAAASVAVLLASCALPDTPSEPGGQTPEHAGLKKNEDMDWVYATVYEAEFTADTYTTEFGETFFAEDIEIPYVNMESAAADKVNADLKALYEEMVEAFNDGADDKITYVDHVEYSFAVNANTLSLIVNYGYGGTDVVMPRFYAANLNLSTGDAVGYAALYQQAGFTGDSIAERAHASIKQAMENLQEWESEEEFESNYALTLADYDSAAADGSVKCYLDALGQLHIIMDVYTPAHWGFYPLDIVVE